MNIKIDKSITANKMRQEDTNSTSHEVTQPAQAAVQNVLEDRPFLAGQRFVELAI